MRLHFLSHLTPSPDPLSSPRPSPPLTVQNGVHPPPTPLVTIGLLDSFDSRPLHALYTCDSWVAIPPLPPLACREP
ncbi:hypothetical protein E2C01_041240 [Portunus trituberculatus]|uniref:Uncharacterized protein n=1 Tax=Portunus trituberculatus TaxID=210409 RepID=A0A5B7FJI2_PORTR|nr:hypothetical protein [Portunus trituberculatus]